jgi:DNA helicase-2/ATP-dependent DNA helicase PcrA
LNSDFAILYRTNSQSRSLEEALRKIGLPYRIYGGTSFYQRKEIKDVIAYLRLTVNHNDEEALKRVVNYPARGIGKTSMERVAVLAAENDVSQWEVVSNAAKFPQLKAAGRKLNDFGTMIKSFATMLESKDAYEIAMQIARSTQLLKSLNEDKTIEGINRYENVVELLNGIKEFTEDDTNESEKDLATYLQDVALFTDADKENDDNDKVSLMTIHQSKGLEYKNVYVSGLEENLFPSQMSLGSRSDLEEERRLFYVAITRAEEKLCLSFATSRFRFGNLLPSEPSRFIDEIDKDYLELDKRMLTSARKQLDIPESAMNKSGLGRTIAKQKPTTSMVKPPTIPNFTPEVIDDLQEGESIEHQRFGKGKVVAIDGNSGSEKAKIMFEDFGEKTLVLKFAKLRRIK